MMDKKLLAIILVVVIALALAVPAVYFLTATKDIPLPPPPKAVQPKNNPPVAGSVTYRNETISNATIHVYNGTTKLELTNMTGLHDLTSQMLLVDADADGVLEVLVADWLENKAEARIILLGM